MCACNSSNIITLVQISNYQLLTVVSCSPPVYSFSANIYLNYNFIIGTAAITITF
jgi:hypothetical protein